jgi:hypothetical protein
MTEAILDGPARILCQRRPVHRLKREVAEVQVLETFGLRLRLHLRIHKLELVAARQHKWRIRLRTYADPVNSRRSELRSVRLDGDLETLRVERPHKALVELQERLTAGTHNVGMRVMREVARPQRRNVRSEFLGCAKLAAIIADTEEIRIAKLTDGVGSILLESRPEVATAEATEHRRSPRVVSLALQGVKNFLNCVHGTESDL